MIMKNGRLLRIKSEFLDRTRDFYWSPAYMSKVYCDLVERFGADVVARAMAAPDLAEGAQTPPPF